MRWVYEPVHHLALRHWHHVNTVWLHLSDSVWILMVNVTSKEVVHGSAVEALSLRYWAVLVSE